MGWLLGLTQNSHVLGTFPHLPTLLKSLWCCLRREGVNSSTRDHLNWSKTGTSDGATGGGRG